MPKFKNIRRHPETKRSAASKPRRGAAMIEFALVLPMLLLLILGIIEMGRVMMLHQVSTNACREASRRAIVPGVTQSYILATANSYLDAGGISDTNRVVSVLDSEGNTVTDLSDIQSHEEVTVEVRFPYAENTWGFTAITGSKNLVSRSTMRRE